MPRVNNANTHIVIVGGGPGGPEQLTLAALKALERANVIYVSKKSALPPRLEARSKPLKMRALNALQKEILKEQFKKVAILVSGDPGLFSIAAAIKEQFADHPVTIYPGISSLQYLCAKTAQSWEDTGIISFHSNSPADVTQTFLPEADGKIFAITSAPSDLLKIAKQFPGRSGWIGCDLATPEENVIAFSNDQELRHLSKQDMVQRARLISVLLAPITPAERSVNHLPKTVHGVGLGPGDPELITVKALKALKEAAVIFYPRSAKLKKSIARDILKDLPGVDPGKLKPVLFPMSENKDVLNEHWQKAAKVIIRSLEKTGPVAFVTLGDPSIYSTFGYLRNELQRLAPDIRFITVPGITAASAIAAQASSGLVEGREELRIVPFSGVKDLPKVLGTTGTVVLYKFGRHMHLLPRLLNHFDEFVLALDAGRKRSKVITNKSEAIKLVGSEDRYLATLILKRPVQPTKSRSGRRA